MSPREFTITVHLNEDEYATVQREIAFMQALPKEESADPLPSWTTEQMLAVMVAHGIYWMSKQHRRQLDRDTAASIAEVR